MLDQIFQLLFLLIVLLLFQKVYNYAGDALGQLGYLFFLRVRFIYGVIELCLYNSKGHRSGKKCQIPKKI